MPQTQTYYPQAIQQAYENDYQTQLAQQLMQMGGSTAPAQTPTVAIARALQGMIGGFQAKKQREKYDSQAESRRAQMAAMLAGIQAGEPLEQAMQFAPDDMKDPLFMAVLKQNMGAKAATAEFERKKEFEKYKGGLKNPTAIDHGGQQSLWQGGKNIGLVDKSQSPGSRLSYGEYSPDGRLTGINPAYAEYQRSKASAGANRVDVTVGAENYSKAAGASAMAKLQDLESSAGTSMNLINSIDQLSAAHKGGTYTGSAAGVQRFVAGWADSAGINVDREKLGNSQYFNQVLTDLAIGQTKKLGVNPTDKDYQIILEGLPRLESQPEVTSQILQSLRNLAEKSVNKYNEMLPEYKNTWPQGVPMPYGQMQVPKSQFGPTEADPLGLGL